MVHHDSTIIICFIPLLILVDVGLTWPRGPSEDCLLRRMMHPRRRAVVTRGASFPGWIS